MIIEAIAGAWLLFFGIGAAKIVNRGLQVIGGRASNTADAFLEIDSMSWDDSSVAFAAGDTALNSGGAVTNEADADFDSVPTRSGQAVTHVATLGTGALNGVTVRRIALHNAAAASVSTSSTTLVGGIDGQAFAKTASFSMTFQETITYADNS